MQIDRMIPSLLLFAFLAAAMGLHGQDPALKEVFLEGKTLWASQGDREKSMAKFEHVIASLEPQATTLDDDWLNTLCESYNWMAVLDDRTPSRKGKVVKDLETLLILNPDFEVDKAITNTRLQKQFEEMRSAKLCRVRMVLTPDNGTLLVDGVIRRGGAIKYLPPGSRKISYAKLGFATVEQQVDLVLRETKYLEFNLKRVSSTITFHVSPVGTEVFLDGRSLGKAAGNPGPAESALSEKLGVPLAEISGPFVISELSPGSHIVEMRLSGYRTRRLELGAALTEPFADHWMESLKLEPSRSFLTVQSKVFGGELFLSGKSYGPLPIPKLQIPAGEYDLEVRYPLGAFAQRITTEEDSLSSIDARPKARLVFLGIEGGDFAGRERLEKAFDVLGTRLENMQMQKVREGEAPAEALTRLKASGEADLVLLARPLPGSGHEMELQLSNLGGAQDVSVIKHLEQDPLESFVNRVNRIPDYRVPWLGFSVLDVPFGQMDASLARGPLVIQVDEEARKAGLALHKEISRLNGKPVTRAADMAAILKEIASGEKVPEPIGEPTMIPVSQNAPEFRLGLQWKATEIPLASESLCYPSLLLEIQIRRQAAQGAEAGILRLNEALCFMHFQQYGQALEALRNTKLEDKSGVCQGTVEYYIGLCLQRLGGPCQAEAGEAFQNAMKYPDATFFGPAGPRVAPLARLALADLKL